MGTTRGLLLPVIVTLLGYYGVTAITLEGSSHSYARYPKWHACVNASISFEFKTTQEEGLLMYTDDGGRYDFLEVIHTSGRVSVVLNIVDGRDGHVQLDVGSNVNDGAWHRVEIKRNRMETTLLVDTDTDSRFAFGSDFNFGDLRTNSEVFFGGLPPQYERNLHQLALPSVLFRTRFQGELRNVLYGNCSCQTVRAGYLDGRDVKLTPREQCDLRNPCREGCICVSTDTEPACDCSELECISGAVTHYALPMDIMLGTTLINPSGLDASAVGAPALVEGVAGKAVQLNTPRQYVKVSGPGHRLECFGDLDLCNLGYTLGFWVRFDEPGATQAVYVSNGGHTERSHGVALLYDRGTAQFRFRRKNGQEWRVKARDVTPGRWYHLGASWGLQEGLFMYVDGENVDQDISPTVRAPELIDTNHNNEFVIGRGNDDASRGREDHKVTMDQFSFWSAFKTGQDIKEIGPFYHHFLPMETMRGNEFSDTKTRNTVHGRPSLVAGKIGRAVSLDGRGDYIDLGDQGHSCLGDLSQCLHGLTLSGWFNFKDLDDNTYYLDSGPRGVKLYYKDNHLVGEFQQGTRNWKVKYPSPNRGRWYFIELSWHGDDGARMYVDLQEVDSAATHTTTERPRGGDSHMYIGRANTNMRRERYASAKVDELEIWYGDRPRLVDLGVVQRGKPTVHRFNFEKPLQPSRRGALSPHDDFRVELRDPRAGGPRARLVTGQIGTGLYLQGSGQYADLGPHRDICFGNLDRCPHGVTFASWVRTGKYASSDVQHYIHTGDNGLDVWYENRKLRCTFKTSSHVWELDYEALEPEQWYQVEYSWHPEKGLSLYINNEHIKTVKNSRARPKFDLEPTSRRHNAVYFGRGVNATTSGVGGEMKTANVTLDQMEYWYADRDYLTAFGYINRGGVLHYILDMDEIRANKLKHELLNIPVYGGCRNVPGVIATAVKLRGGDQYMDVGQHSGSCLGNLQRCSNGYTGSMFVKFPEFEEGMYYISTGDQGINMFYKNGRLNLRFQINGKRWEVPLSQLETDNWYFLEYTWHPDSLLRVYLNNRLVGAGRPETVPYRPWDSDGNHFYIGRAHDDSPHGARARNGKFTIDHHLIWFDTRENLIADGLIVRDDIHHVLIPFEEQLGDIISHPIYRIDAHGGAGLSRGRVGNALHLDGRSQYAVIENQEDSCMGNLERCQDGITVSVWVRTETEPGQDTPDDTYFLSTGTYSLYYRDGALHADVLSPRKDWHAQSRRFNPSNNWQKVDMSWSKEDGLELYVNNEKLSADEEGTPHGPRPAPRDYGMYFGRPNPERVGRNTKGYIDEVDVWYATRDILVIFGYIDNSGDWEPTTPPPPTPPPTPVRTTPPDRDIIYFYGDNWIMYDLSQLDEEFLRDNDYEEFYISFKTRQPDGLIWFTGNQERNLHLSLQGGSLVLMADYGQGIRNYDRFTVRPRTGRLDDDRWHDVRIVRRGRQVTIGIDDEQFRQEFNENQPVPRIISPGGVIFVGGMANVRKHTNGQSTDNLDGQVRTIRVNGNSLRHHLDLAGYYHESPRPSWVIINGDFPREPPVPGNNGVFFSRPNEDSLRLPKWEGQKLQFKFRTVEPNGLIMNILGRRGTQDFAAIEMYDGILYVVMNVGDGVHHIRASETVLNDGQPHSVKIDRTGGRMRIEVDERTVTHELGARADDLDPATFLHLGGIDKTARERTPWHLWTKSSREYFLGCVFDLMINDDGQFLNLPRYARDQGGALFGIEEGCPEMARQCTSYPCLNNAPCHNMFSGYKCDCSDTMYTGQRCSREAQIVSFDGNDYLRIRFRPGLRTHTNDISLRFKTRKQDGVLFTTSNDRNDDFLRAVMDRGRVRVLHNIGGEERFVQLGQGLNDNRWHTLHLKRRADHLEIWIDDGLHDVSKIPDENFSLDIDTIVVGAPGIRFQPNEGFEGQMLNFYFDQYDFFSYLKEGNWPDGTEGDGTITGTGNPVPENKVTFGAGEESYAALRKLDTRGDLEVAFMFKTTEENGLLMYHPGRAEEFLAIELVGGYIHYLVNDGSGVRILVARTPRLLNDDKWHYVKASRSSSGELSVSVDGQETEFPGGGGGRGDGRLDLDGLLYIGGVPRVMYRDLPEQVVSTHGFRGCMATITIRETMINLHARAVEIMPSVTQGCRKVVLQCERDHIDCRNFGTCINEWVGYWCNCNMTSYVQDARGLCTREAEGYEFGKEWGTAMVHYNYTLYTFDKPIDTYTDELAVGFMTWMPNGTIIRVDSKDTNDFIEIKMENGHVVALYDMGEGQQRLVENSRYFDDGKYHVVRFFRTNNDGVLQVDTLPTREVKPVGTSVYLFNYLSGISVGAKQNKSRLLYDAFKGIIAGVYFNGVRVIDSAQNRFASDHGRTTIFRSQGSVDDDLIVADHLFYLAIALDERVSIFYGHGATAEDLFVARHRFYLPRPRPRPTPPPTTVPPTPLVPSIPPTPEVVVTPSPGGGTKIPPPPPITPYPVPDFIPPGKGGGGVGWAETFGGQGLEIDVAPGGGGGGYFVESGGGGGVAQAVQGPPVVAGGSAEGGRAMGIAGALLGSLLFASALVWALYKFKPGLIPMGGGGAAAAPASGAGMAISSPRATTLPLLPEPKDAAAGAGEAGAASGTQAAVQEAAFADYFSSMSASSAAGGAYAAAGGGGTMHRAVQTEVDGGAAVAAVDASAANGAAGGFAALESMMQETGLGDKDKDDSDKDKEGDDDASKGKAGVPLDAETQKLLDELSEASTFQESKSYSTMEQSGFQMQNMQAGYAQSLMGAEEIHVDNFLFTSDSNQVVTGSIYGPPQVWDMTTGNFVRNMTGEDLSSTDLHLACNDTLLVGQVAEMSEIDPSDVDYSSRVHNRKLQIWDFETGQPLEMPAGQAPLCTASCLMNDGERIVLGRTDKFGGGTSVVIWDLLANEAVRTMEYKGAVGFADYISFLKLSKDNRYVIAGFQNSYDGNANFIIFDLSEDSYQKVEPKVLALDANSECTAILDNHEAVTGTRKGEIVIWSMRTGKINRQLATGSADTLSRSGVSPAVAHMGEVKAVDISPDGKTLVSASADGTLKAWDMETEKLMYTCTGHKDEVWSCTISEDGELLASGSKDGTIRLWKLATGQHLCSFQTGVDVFKIRMSRTKRTIVALGDRDGARKLIMLQIVRQKVRSRAPSRATSPYGTQRSRPQSPYRSNTPSAPYH